MRYAIAAIVGAFFGGLVGPIVAERLRQWMARRSA